MLKLILTPIKYPFDLLSSIRGSGTARISHINLSSVILWTSLGFSIEVTVLFYWVSCNYTLARFKYYKNYSVLIDT